MSDFEDASDVWDGDDVGDTSDVWDADDGSRGFLRSGMVTEWGLESLAIEVRVGDVSPEVSRLEPSHGNLWSFTCHFVKGGRERSSWNLMEGRITIRHNCSGCRHSF